MILGSSKVKQSALLARLSEPTGMFNDNPARLIESYVFTQLQHYKLSILPLSILLLKYTEASSDPASPTAIWHQLRHLSLSKQQQAKLKLPKTCGTLSQYPHPGQIPLLY